MDKQRENEMCPNCVTPWKCNGPHIPAQQQAEPVAWRVKWPAMGGGWKWLMVDAPLLEKEGFVNEPLYAAPAPTVPAEWDWADEGALSAGMAEGNKLGVKSTDALRIISAYTMGLVPKAPAPDRRELQAQGKHPAPCARHCESAAYEIMLRNLRSEVKQLRDALTKEQP